VELVVVDESHNFRNPMSNRWENLFTLLNEHMKGPKVLFLTATPINNTVWDLYWQIMLLVKNNESAFIRENVPDLSKFFKMAESNPTLLNDLLNEISIRRTRDYIIKNYPDAYIIGPSGEKEKIIFPRRVLENVNYKLDETYRGCDKEISDTIANKLTMAYYRRLEYKKGGVETEEERFELGRMQAIGGIFRTILLKRLESSVYAFRESLKDHISFLETMKGYMEKGKLLSKNPIADMCSAWTMRLIQNLRAEMQVRWSWKTLIRADTTLTDCWRMWKGIFSLLNGMLERSAA